MKTEPKYSRSIFANIGTRFQLTVISEINHTQHSKYAAMTCPLKNVHLGKAIALSNAYQYFTFYA